MVHLDGAITDELKARVNAALAPAYLSQYLPENTFLVHATPEHMLRFAENRPAEVSWVGELPAAPRVSSELKHRVLETRVHNREVHGEDSAMPIELHVSFPVDIESRTFEEAQAIASLWHPSVARFPDTTLEVVSKDVVIVRTPGDHAEDVAAALAAEPEVQWVEVRGIFKTLNVWTRQLIQGGTQQTATAGTSPLLAVGLDGKGMVVGVGDSGMDMSHCFFSDTVTTPLYPTISTTHRKVATYDNFVDVFDSDDAAGGGHGTHVCGTIAGNGATGTRASLQRDTGMAPGAKIAFIDIGPTTGTNLGSLSIPADVYARYFVSAYASGARIHSNSWGSSPVNAAGAVGPNTYTTTARDFDRFMFANNDFVALVAAGNDGDAGDSTIGSPAVAKNVITVGAGSNTNQGWRGYCCMDGQLPCWLSPTQQCNTATTQDMLTNPQNWDEDNLAFFSSTGPLNTDGRIKPEIAAPGYQTISSESNGASTTPQCGDGTTTSASDYMAVTAKAGTSMATPATAGSLAVVRQYLTEGWYPTGAKVAANAITPSGALMKAMIMAGAKPMTGNVINGGTPVSPLPATYPNKYVGSGRLALDQTLYVAALDQPLRQKIFLGAAANGDNSITTGATNTHCVQALSAAQLRFSLVWTDPAATTLATVALINNLDLKVDQPNGGATLNGNGAAASDTVNPWEIVTVATPVVGGVYCARVIGTAVVQSSPQKYAFVVVGDVDPTQTVTPPTTSTSTTTGTTTPQTSTTTAAGGTTAPGGTTTAPGGTTTAPGGTTSTGATTSDPNAIVTGGASDANSGNGSSISSAATIGISIGVVIVIILAIVAIVAVVTMGRRASARRNNAASAYADARGKPAQPYEPPAPHAAQTPAPYAAPNRPAPNRPTPGGPAPYRDAPGAPARNGPPPAAPRPAPRY